MLYDLHIHTTASDGTSTPEDIVMQAEKLGLLGIAITDHDTTAGLTRGMNAIKEGAGKLDFIPGIELNAEINGVETHILGYFINHNNRALNNRLYQIKQERRDRADKMIAKIQDIGININIEQVKQFVKGEMIGRPHIAQALLAQGYVNSVGEAFKMYIGQGRPAYVNRYKFLPEEAINLIHGAGGVSIIAHPGLISRKEFIYELIAMGVNGLEVYYPDHHEEQIRWYRDLCNKFGLLLTGGSDYHGYNNKDSRGRLGSCGINQAGMDQIKNYHKSMPKLP